MPDLMIRELERQAEVDPSSAARLLSARLRLGELDEQDLLLAAHVGHEPARLALGRPPVASAWTLPSPTDEELAGAVEHQLHSFGRHPVVFVALTAAEYCRAMGDVYLSPRWFDLTRTAVRLWLVRPSDEHARRVHELTGSPTVSPAGCSSTAMNFTGATVRSPLPLAAHCAAISVHMACRSVKHTADAVSAVRPVLQSALIGWALRQSELRSSAS